MTTGMFPRRGGGPKAHALENERAIRGLLPANTNWERSGIELGFRQQKAATAADYDAWLATVCSAKGTRRKIDGQKLRRAVIMRRNGYSVTDAAKVVGMANSGLGKWLDALPPELAV